MGEHRVPLLSGALRRYEDPESSSDPRVRAVVAELRELEPRLGPEPRAHFRAELRAQLVAVTPRLVAEGLAEDGRTIAPRAAATTATAAARPAGRRPSPHPRPEPEPPRDPAPSLLDRLRALPLGRPLGVLTAVVVAFAVLLGGAVWMSRKALPGDALYGLKRASENVRIALDSDPVSKAKDYLGLADTRLAEAKDLLARSGTSASGRGPLAAGVDTHTASLVTSTLGSSDSDVRRAAQLLGSQAVKTGSPAPLTVMTAWAPRQLSALRSLAATVPAGTVHDRLTSSASLVDQAVARAHALQAKASCSCLSSSGTDSLGPKPCLPCTTPATSGGRNGTGSATPSTAPGTRGTQSAGTGSRGASGTPSAAPSGAPGGGASGSGSAGGSGSPSGLPSLPHLPLPSLPHLPLPTGSQLPLNVSSCGVGVTLGPLGVQLGSCPSSPH